MGLEDKKTEVQSGNGLAEKNDNVLDLKQDEKLKLQLEIRKMVSDLKTDVSKKQQTQELENSFRNLLFKTKISVEEYNTTKQKVEKLYSEAKGGDQTETIKKMQEEIDLKLTTDFVRIDENVEHAYDLWVKNINTNQSIDALESSFSVAVSSIVVDVNKLLLTQEELQRMTYRFELTNLKQQILDKQNKQGVRDPVRYGANPSINGTPSTSNDNSEGSLKSNVEIPDYTNLYKDAYPVANLGGENENIYNVYKDGEMREVMDKILDKGDALKLSKGTFGVNLSRENGFANVLATIGGKNGKTNIGGYEFFVDYADKNSTIKLINTPNGYRDNGQITADDLKAMTTAGLLNYKHEKGFLQFLDNEFAKMAKIINKAKWSDLSTFVALSDARSKQSSSLKEFVNARDSKTRPTEENVFAFLCDRNGDGYISYNKKANKEQKNVGDVGNIFGAQLKWSIDQAIRVQEAINPEQGEKIVIKNIMTNIDIQDSRFGAEISDRQKRSELYQEFARYSDINYCTRAHLVQSLEAHPEFKVFFGAAIEKINGSDSVITPALYDTLTGNTVDRFLKEGDWKFRKSLETKIDYALLKKFGKTELDDTTIKLRENLITKIMNIADGFTIVGSDSKEGNLRNAGVSKEFVSKEAKQAFINDLTNTTLSSIAVGVFTGDYKIRIPVDFIKNGRSENGRTLWRVQAGPGVGYNRETQDIGITLGVGGEIAEQYNYNKVINAPLDEVMSARYLGVEGSAVVGMSIKNLNAGAEASAGINWQKDPITGINQINRQYENVSKTLFRINESDLTSYQTIYKALERRINTADGAYKDFVATNKERLIKNADFIVSFLAANDVLKFTQSTSAINALITLLQEGNMEQWRSDLLNNIHGNIDITKLSFGVTTNMLKMSFDNKSSDNSSTHTGSSNTGTNSGSDVSGKDINSFTNPGTTYKFGIFGFYVGARISNWKTSYKINSQQLAHTRSEIAEGKNTDRAPSFKDLDKYATYLKAMLNVTDATGVDQINITPDTTKRKLIISNLRTDVKLANLLNIRVTETAIPEVHYDEQEDILTIGDVKTMAAYTTAQPDGVVRQLIIGSKNYKDGSKANLLDSKYSTPKNIQSKESGNYEAVNKKEITTNLAKLEYFTNQTEMDIFSNCFGENGQIDMNTKPENVEITKSGTIEAGKLIVFTKTGDNKYSLSVEESTNPSLLSLRVINGKLINGKQVEFKETSSHTIDFVPKTIDTTIKDFFKKIDPTKYPRLEQEQIGPFMNGKTIDEQVATLQGLLKDKPDFTLITTALTNTPSLETKTFIVNQFKGIFAYETSYPNKLFATLYRERYQFLKAFTDLPTNLKTEIITERRTILNNPKLKYTRDNRKSVNNLFGYTAFYRTKEGVDPKADLVSGGDTKVMKIGGLPTFKLKNQDEAKTWISQKLNAKPTEKQMIWDGILKNISDDGLKDVLSKLSEENKDTLIKTGSLAIDNGLKKISLDSTAVLYFKAECMNESLGLEVEKISIAETPANDISIEKELIPDLTLDNKLYSPGAKANVNTNNLNGKYYGEANLGWGKKKGDGSKTRTGSDGDGGNSDDDVNGHEQHNF